ncbi:MAG TPA: hypothetical protein VMW56_30040 [Candidatus Margulisiibacteriota bacterium]|nr:hypothetical protein [Candidatus Margulisiibacteriota bacterium]
MDHALTEMETRSMLAAFPGAAFVGRYIVGELPKTHPSFRE